MEMRIEEKLGQEQLINLIEFEDFIFGSELGLIITDENWNTTIKSPEEIAEELLLDEVEELHYIENDNTVKILFRNGCNHLATRV